MPCQKNENSNILYETLATLSCVTQRTPMISCATAFISSCLSCYTLSTHTRLSKLNPFFSLRAVHFRDNEKKRYFFFAFDDSVVFSFFHFCRSWKFVALQPISYHSRVLLRLIIRHGCVFLHTRSVCAVYTKRVVCNCTVSVCCIHSANE